MFNFSNSILETSRDASNFAVICISLFSRVCMKITNFVYGRGDLNILNNRSQCASNLSGLTTTQNSRFSKSVRTYQRFCHLPIYHFLLVDNSLVIEAKRLNLMHKIYS